MNWQQYIPKNWQQLAIYAAVAGFIGLLTLFGLLSPGDVPLPDPPAPVFVPSDAQTGGWVKDDEAVRAIQETLRFKVFADTPAGESMDPLPEAVYLWQSYAKLFARGPPSRNQLNIGSCVSFGTNTAIERTLATQIVLAKGSKDEFKDLANEVTYGGSRVQIGKGRLGNGDGSVGAWAAQFVQQWGIVERAKIAGEDLSTYSVSTCRTYGVRGVPAPVQAVAKERPVKDITLVKTWDSAKKALASGYGIAICSGQGFTMQRDANGVCRASGSWAHCVPRGTMISTQIPRPCEDIRVGDQVIAHDGKFHSVLKVIPNHYEGNLRVIESFGATPVKFTPEHPLLVYRRMTHGVRQVPAGVDFRKWNNGASKYQVEAFEKWESGQPAWIAASDVRPGDYLLSPEVESSKEVRMPEWHSSSRTLNVPHKITRPTTELAWLFGLYIADGNAIDSHKVLITLNKSEVASTAKAMAAFRSLGVEPSIIDGENHVRVVAYSADIANSFREWFGTESHIKKIPEFLFHGWDLLSVVDGIFDGDGCDHQNAKVIHTTSPALALQIHQILLSNGQNPSMCEVHRNGGEFPNARKSWTVEWRPGAQKSFMRHWRGFYLMPVSKISDEPYSGTVYNYEVEGAHSYLAWNVVSHNCMALDGYTKINGKEYGHIENSWGESSHTGPVGPGDPPPSGFWADSATITRMLGEGDSWAFSSVTGFPVRTLDWFVRARPQLRDDRLFAAIGTQFATLP